MEEAQKKDEHRLHYRIKQCKINGSFDINNYISEHNKLLQPMEKVGKVNNASIIDINWIFDLNEDISVLLEI